MTAPQPEETLKLNWILDRLIEDVLNERKYGDGLYFKHRETALDRINTYFNKLAEEIIGPDKVKPISKPSIPFRTVHQNQLRAEQRKRKAILLKKKE